ncbi:hypothetical protein [Chitinophaga vietnamensis]|uniref:hypothetical protein n=1 Tax=Chitinophaga vietnamensis TaxID=2593957 RepID=UPI0011774D6E|nr:hypothetical protein [Chitinophaga vietnamensis]
MKRLLTILFVLASTLYSGQAANRLQVLKAASPAQHRPTARQTDSLRKQWMHQQAMVNIIDSAKPPLITTCEAHEQWLHTLQQCPPQQQLEMLTDRYCHLPATANAGSYHTARRHKQAACLLQTNNYYRRKARRPGPEQPSGFAAGTPAEEKKNSDLNSCTHNQSSSLSP